MTFRCLAFVFTALLPFFLHAGTQDDAAWKKVRKDALNRPRRVIFNNDGNEPVYLCKTVSERELLDARTTALAGTHVDSIFYCTWSSGFGLFTHDTKAGQVFDAREGLFSNNLTRVFLERKIDPLQAMVLFGHKNGIEVFWSFRVNDTHDASSAPYGSIMFRANKLKNEHPEYLIGSITNRPKFGGWSAVNYGLPQIRDLAFQYCEEVCTNYDVDGIELDFFRHALLFKCSAEGKPCGETELNALTSLMRRIRDMTEAQGRKRGRPILLAIRVPDSIEYCRTIGIDLERWLHDGLVDLLVVSGYTQLNSWKYSVELGRKYHVKVYPSLDEPRIRDEAARKLRASDETYRGRALAAWAAGVDGIYMFNFFDPTSSLWHELGDANVLVKLPHNYFVSVRGKGAVPVPHDAFIKVPVLNPAATITFTNNTAQFVLNTGSAGRQMKQALLRVRCKLFAPEVDMTCKWNGKNLKSVPVAGDWIAFAVPIRAVKSGENVIGLTFNSSAKRQPVVLDAFLEIQ